MAATRSTARALPPISATRSRRPRPTPPRSRSTPSTLTYAADPQSRIYGDANPALTGTVTGFKNGESIPTATTGTLAFATPAVPASNVGTYAINGSGLTANNGNYAFVQAGTNGTALIVTQRPITLTAGSAAREYGDPNPAVAVTANPTAPGTGVAPHETLAAAFPSLGAASGAIGTTPVGNYTAGPNAYSVTGATNANYLVTPVQGALAITPATLTYVANAAAREYGDPNPVLSGAVTGFKNGETIGTATTGALAFTTAAIGTTPVGAYAIDGGGLAAANYAFVQAPGNATALTISPRLITLNAGSAARAYGDANPVPAPLYTVGGGGMANAENAQTLFGFTVTSGAVANTAVGTYSTGANAYNVAGVVVGVNGNYNIAAINPGTLTIGQRAIQVTADPNQTKIYGEPNPAAYTYALTSGSLVGTDGLSGATTRVAGENVGPYPIQQGTLTRGAKLRPDLRPRQLRDHRTPGHDHRDSGPEQGVRQRRPAVRLRGRRRHRYHRRGDRRRRRAGRRARPQRGRECGRLSAQPGHADDDRTRELRDHLRSGELCYYAGGA